MWGKYPHSTSHSQFGPNIYRSGAIHKYVAIKRAEGVEYNTHRKQRTVITFVRVCMFVFGCT